MKLNLQTILQCAPLPMNNKLISAFNLREKLDLSKTNAFRALHRREWEYLDASVDIYDKWFLIWVYGVDSRTSRYLDELSKTVVEHYKCLGGVVKFPQKNPFDKGLIGEQNIVLEAPPAWFTVQENGIDFKVTLTEKQHTGLFLDQRNNRRWVLENSHSLRVANLFCFTSSFSVAALLGGAESVHSVDITKSVLTWGEKNLALNRIQNFPPNKRAFFYCDDVREWLRRQTNKTEKDPSLLYDLIICDPPTFSSGDKKHGKFDVEKEWTTLIKTCKKISKPGGQFLFSTNFQKSDIHKLKKPLDEAFKMVKIIPPPVDFPILENAPTFTHYFLCR